MMKVYVHTMNGSLATFDGTQIVYATRHTEAVATLGDIKAEQKRTLAYRSKRGFSCSHDYSHKIICVQGEPGP